MVEQVVQCQKYCQDKQKLEIIFTNEKGKELNLICSPLEQTYIKRKICLKVMGNSGSRVYEIPIENIKSIKQLPIAATSASIPTTVVFKIKNRLAKNYKMRDWERLDKIEADGSQIIVNKSEDLETHSVQSTTETKHRKAQPFKVVEEKKEPQYKIINGQRVPV